MRFRYTIVTALLCTAISLTGCEQLKSINFSSIDSFVDSFNEAILPDDGTTNSISIDEKTSKSKAEPVKEGDVIVVDESEKAENRETGISKDDIETIPVKLSLVNLCGVDIGMFSMLDPITGEQINLTSLKNQESKSFDEEWPKDIKELKWALYNEKGDLSLEATSDISGITKSVVLSISGNENVSDVSIVVE